VQADTVVFSHLVPPCAAIALGLFATQRITRAHQHFFAFIIIVVGSVVVGFGHGSNSSLG
jgi:hypothetical protein